MPLSSKSLENEYLLPEIDGIDARSNQSNLCIGIDARSN